MKIKKVMTSLAVSPSRQIVNETFQLLLSLSKRELLLLTKRQGQIHMSLNNDYRPVRPQLSQLVNWNLTPPQKNKLNPQANSVQRTLQTDIKHGQCSTCAEYEHYYSQYKYSVNFLVLMNSVLEFASSTVVVSKTQGNVV